MIEEDEAVGVNTEVPRLIEAMADRSFTTGHGAERHLVLIVKCGIPRNA
ncbi:hypothetical protein [Streptomyces sp. NPDC001135]